MSNKLFCSFIEPDSLEDFIEDISLKYDILFKKIFSFTSDAMPEYICTYNIETGNINFNYIKNTILVHRKKESNTLYTINALNKLILKLNGRLDNRYKVNWRDYRNSILLVRNNELEVVNLDLHKIFYVD